MVNNLIILKSLLNSSKSATAVFALDVLCVVEAFNEGVLLSMQSEVLGQIALRCECLVTTITLE